MVTRFIVCFYLSVPSGESNHSKLNTKNCMNIKLVMHCTVTADNYLSRP